MSNCKLVRLDSSRRVLCHCPHSPLSTPKCTSTVITQLNSELNFTLSAKMIYFLKCVIFFNQLFKAGCWEIELKGTKITFSMNGKLTTKRKGSVLHLRPPQPPHGHMVAGHHKILDTGHLCDGDISLLTNKIGILLRNYIFAPNYQIFLLLMALY